MSVHSDLNASGFTAAFSTILANAGKINLKEVFLFMFKFSVSRLTVVNFINISHAHFAPIFWCQKISNPKHSFVIFGTQILHKICTNKTLMKLTHGGTTC